MLKQNSILYSIVDREDGWVSTALCFECDRNLNFEEAYNLLKPKLESKEVIEYVIKDHCLESDLFGKYFDYEDGHPKFEFKETRWERCLVYVFETEDGDVVEHTFTQTDFIAYIKS